MSKKLNFSKYLKNSSNYFYFKV